MALRFRPPECAVLVIDVQPKFMAGIDEGDRVVRRSEFLVRIAKLLGVPVLGSEQNVERMGGTDQRLAPHLDGCFAKMAFSCAGCTGFMQALEATGRRTAVLVGIETHICVTQTALDLQEQGYEVAVCPDAVGARSLERHKLGMERMRDAGATPIHSEALAYEWMKTADHPAFKEALALVKEFA